MRRLAGSGVLLVALTMSCEPPRRADRARSGGTSTSTTSTTTPAPAPATSSPTLGMSEALALALAGPQVILSSDLNELEIRAFRRRARLRLPRYKKTIKAYAKKHGFDWRLIAAIAYVESHFNPLAKSHTGVRGLMQLTRVTAASMDVKNRLDPHQSIRGGVRYLDRLHGHFDEILEFHRTLFAMASYNVGYGHVRDAQRLARRRGEDPRIWQSLEQILPLLSDEDIAALTRYGKARGREPVAYVRSICNYFVLQKQDDCRRRDLLSQLVVGSPPVNAPSPLPDRLSAAAEGDVITLSWSHPYVCAIDDCHLFARVAPQPATRTAPAAGP